MNLGGWTVHWVENVEHGVLKLKVRMCTVEFRKIAGSPEIKHKRIFLVLQFRGEKEMATRSSTLAWKIPWTGRPQLMGSQRVGHD